MTIVQTYYTLTHTRRLRLGCRSAGRWGRHAAVMWRLDATGHWLKVGPICAVVSAETEDDYWTQHAGFVVPDCRLTRLRLSRQLSWSLGNLCSAAFRIPDDVFNGSDCCTADSAVGVRQ